MRLSSKQVRQYVQKERHAVRSKSLKRVLVLLGWSSTEISREICRFALEAGWLIDARTFYSHEVPAAWHGDGLLATFGERADLNQFILQHATRQPTVILGGDKRGIPVPAVHIDNHAVGCKAAQHLLDRNHQHFAWYGFYQDQGEATEQQQNGFAQTVRAAGFRCEILRYRSTEDSVNWIHRRQWIESRLKTLPRPLGVFAMDDLLASEVSQVCLEQGWGIPDEISVLGAGNLDLTGECSHIPISSVDTRDAEVARKAAETLDQLMRHDQAPQDAVLSPGAVITRASTDNTATVHPVVKEAVRFMKENLSNTFGADEIAKVAKVSRRALYSLFSHELNTTPASMLTTLRLELAKRMLLDTEDKIATIAVRCGFGTSRTFDRAFIKAEGSTPAAWRAVTHRSRTR